MTTTRKTTDGYAGSNPEEAGHLSVIMDGLPVGVLLLDSDLRVVRVNTAATRILGPCVDLATALSVATIDGCKQDWTRELQDVLRTGSPRHVDSLRLVDPKNSVRVVNLTVARVGNGNSQRVELAIVMEDVTVRVNLEERVRSAEDMAAVGRLAARVAHELNNPLDGALRYINLCERTIADTADPHRDSLRYLDEARQGLLRMAQIIADLLEFSRNTPMVKENGNINAVVDEAIRSMSDYADGSSVVVAAGFHDEDRMPVLGGTRLYQVCCNLIRNAIDAMPDGGCLTVTSGVVNDDVVIRFEDTGVGLPEDSERVFEPFYTTKPAGKGTGLGLAICRDYIAQLGGAIIAETNAPQGAVFTVRVPLASCGAASRPGQ